MKKAYFDGYYFKQQNQHDTVAFIPAMHIDRAGRKTASLQLITDSFSHSIPISQSMFSLSRSPFFIQCGNCSFSELGCKLDIQDKNLSVHGQLNYGKLSPINCDIMGYFRFVPFMQCRHTVVSMDHPVSGALEINGKLYEFSAGKGYIEGDRGTSFPKKYIWTQCNQFKNDKLSIMLSAADIPIGNKSFMGCIASIQHHNQELCIATYNGAKIKRIRKNSIILAQGNYELRADLIQANPLSLRAPCSGAMERIIHESASCIVRYQLKHKNNTVFDIVSTLASFESEGF